MTMATKKKPHVISDVIKDLEATGKKMRVDLRRLGKDANLGKGLSRLATDLRKGAASVGKHVEQYLREVQKEAAAARKRATKPRKKPRKKAAAKTARKRPAAKKRRAAKKTDQVA
jgi:hypothetical protein